jgi:hypothetical protein
VVGLGFASQGTKKGEFEFKDLPAGDYLLLASTEKGDRRYAMTSVRLNQEDREGLLLKLDLLPLLRGRIEGLRDNESVRVIARAMGWREGADTRSGKNGEFSLALLPGTYVLEVAGLRETQYVAGGGLRRVAVPGEDDLVFNVREGTGDVLCFAAPSEEIHFENDGERRTVVAELNGMVTAKGLPPGVYRVTGEAGKPREIEVKPKTIVGVEVAR